VEMPQLTMRDEWVYRLVCSDSLLSSTGKPFKSEVIPSGCGPGAVIFGFFADSSKGRVQLYVNRLNVLHAGKKKTEIMELLKRLAESCGATIQRSRI